jgi:hypothetical protein
MSIQEDLQICKSGDGIEIVGLVDLGEEGNICKIALGSIHTCKNTSEIINLELINSFPK